MDNKKEEKKYVIFDNSSKPTLSQLSTEALLKENQVQHKAITKMEREVVELKKERERKAIKRCDYMTTYPILIMRKQELPRIIHKIEEEIIELKEDIRRLDEIEEILKKKNIIFFEDTYIDISKLGKPENFYECSKYLDPTVFWPEEEDKELVSKKKEEHQRN